MIKILSIIVVIFFVLLFMTIAGLCFWYWIRKPRSTNFPPPADAELGDAPQTWKAPKDVEIFHASFYRDDFFENVS